MKKLKSFSKFFESSIDVPKVECEASNLRGTVTLYRLTSHPVIDLQSPGEYYVCSQESINPSLLNNFNSIPKENIHLITVTCDSSNIDLFKSQSECDKMKNPSIVTVKDSNKCEVVSVVPYEK